MLTFALLLVGLRLAAGQVGQRIDMELCLNSQENYWKFNGSNYFYSGYATDLEKEEQKVLNGTRPGTNYTGAVFDFGRAVEYCSLRCMALVSLETEEEWDFIRGKMEELGVPFVWTSGHKCDKTVGPDCFTAPSVQPRLINGWFWSGSGAKIPATNKKPPGWSKSPWGRTGLLTLVNQQNNPDAPAVPQPDNAELEAAVLKKQEESCLALATNLWQDETVWNDIACYHEKPWICEDNPKLLRTAQETNNRRRR